MDGKVGTEHGDASNVKVGKPPGTKKLLTWLQTMWAIVPLNIREWAKNVIKSPRAWGEDNSSNWRQIVDDATKRPLNLGTQNDVDSAFDISSEILQSVAQECDQVSTMRDGTKPAEPPPELMQCHKLNTEKILGSGNPTTKICGRKI